MQLAGPSPGKACPVVTRQRLGRRQFLAFAHPCAGCQIVKGSIEPGESPSDAALRELREESGIALSAPPQPFATLPVAALGPPWYFFHSHLDGLPDHWTHQAPDDGGHLFRFFWHPLELPLGPNWHTTFHRAVEIIRTRLPTA